MTKLSVQSLASNSRIIEHECLICLRTWMPKCKIKYYYFATEKCNFLRWFYCLILSPSHGVPLKTSKFQKLLSHSVNDLHVNQLLVLSGVDFHREKRFIFQTHFSFFWDQFWTMSKTNSDGNNVLRLIFARLPYRLNIRGFRSEKKILLSFRWFYLVNFNSTSPDSQLPTASEFCVRLDCCPICMVHSEQHYEFYDKLSPPFVKHL